jgi:MFS family permease
MLKMPKLSKNTKLLSISSFLTDISTEMIVPLLPFFLTGIMGAPVFVVGLMEGIREFAAEMLGVFSSIYSDKIGRRKKIIIAGYSFSTLSKAFLLIASSWWHVLGIAFLDRVGKGIRKVPRDALMVQSEPRGNLGKAFGFRKMLDNLGALVGPAIVAILFAGALVPGMDSSYRTIFAIALVPGIFAVIVLFFVKDRQTKPQSAKKILASVLKEARGFGPFLIAAGIFAMGAFSIPLFLLKSGEYLSLALIPVAYLLYNASATFFALPAGYFTDRFGGKNALVAMQILFLLALAGFAFFAAMPLMFLFMLILGAYMAFSDTAPRVFLAKLVPQRNYASALGAYNGMLGMLALPANLIAGFLWDKTLYGLPAAFAFSIATTLLAIAIFTLFVKGE